MTAEAILYKENDPLLRYAIYKAYKYRCAYTGKFLYDYSSMHLDHIIPQNTAPEVLQEKIRKYHLADDFTIDSLENILPTKSLHNNSQKNRHPFSEPAERFFLEYAQRGKWKIEREYKILKKQFELSKLKVFAEAQLVEFNLLPPEVYKASRKVTNSLSLQINDTANIRLSQDDFDFRIFSDPNELRKTIEDKNKTNNKSRMVAGYCWDWKSKRNPEATDVNIPDFGFAMKWNLEKDGSTWIIGENSIHEIGCIHTCQGLELDYAGVIIGNDLRYENGKVVTDVTKRSRMDSSVKGIKVGRTPAQAAQLAEELIKNTYRTLLTRGMKGCYVYFCDKPLENYFRQQLELPQEKAKVVSLPEPQGPRIEREVNDDVKYIDYLPLYTLKAACGKFGEWQQAEEEGWIKTEGMGKLTSGMFIVQANGHSMEPRIMDGDFCVFRANIVGSRIGKIVLVQHREHYDFENGGSYSIKKYSSEKKQDPETGEWMHERIILYPLNPDYQPIEIRDEEGFIVVGEFIGIVK